MLQYKDTCHSWTELKTDQGKIGPWGRDLFGVQFNYLFSFFLAFQRPPRRLSPRRLRLPLEKITWFYCSQLRVVNTVWSWVRVSSMAHGIATSRLRRSWVQSRLNVFVLAGNLRQLSLAAVRRAVSVCMLHRVANHSTEWARIAIWEPEGPGSGSLGQDQGRTSTQQTRRD